jgi:broad specificity phosphatase PhoE
MTLGPVYILEKLRALKVRGTAVLMRHGLTAWNREGRVMGRAAVELDDEGRAQVEEGIPLARAMRPELIVTSPLVRARQSAEIIADGLGGIEVVEDAQLEEVRYGRWEGMTYWDLIDDPDYLRYREGPIDLPTPGGETLLEVQARGVSAVMRAVGANRGRRVLFVSHGDIIRAILSHFMAMPLEHFRRIRVDNATFSAIEITDSFAEVKFLNLLTDPGRAFLVPERHK